MKPWDIIGWIILLAMAVVAALFLLRMLLLVSVSIAMRVRHLWTRNTPPARDQLWLSACGNSRCRIHSVSDERITVSTTSSVIYDTPESWKRRVKNDALFLP